MVNAASDQTITLPNTASLSATATDDGLPAGSTVTLQWSVDSGGAVTFANASIDIDDGDVRGRRAHMCSG